MKWFCIFGLGIALLSSGCARGVHSPAGFRLPENGDVERGRRAFTDLECFACHTVAGVETPAPSGSVLVPLGGEVREVRTDGYLVTAIIHPSHRIRRVPGEQTAIEGQSVMPDFTASMTVRQLVDLVAFLQSRYRLQPPTGYPYVGASAGR